MRTRHISLKKKGKLIVSHNRMTPGTGVLRKAENTGSPTQPKSIVSVTHVVQVSAAPFRAELHSIRTWRKAFVPKAEAQMKFTLVHQA